MEIQSTQDAIHVWKGISSFPTWRSWFQMALQQMLQTPAVLWSRSSLRG